jgi:hypothetical protein
MNIPPNFLQLDAFADLDIEWAEQHCDAVYGCKLGSVEQFQTYVLEANRNLYHLLYRTDFYFDTKLVKDLDLVSEIETETPTFSSIQWIQSPGRRWTRPELGSVFVAETYGPDGGVQDSLYPHRRIPLLNGWEIVNHGRNMWVEGIGEEDPLEFYVNMRRYLRKEYFRIFRAVRGLGTGTYFDPRLEDDDARDVEDEGIWDNLLRVMCLYLIKHWNMIEELVHAPAA